MVAGDNRLLSLLLSKYKPFLSANPNPSPLPFVPLIRTLCSSSEPNPNLNPRTRTPLEKQFESWVDRLRPGFTAGDLDVALRAQPDPDLALDLFRWAALRPGYRHSPETYLTALRIAADGRRYSAAEALVGDVLAGACPADRALFNAAVRFCCSRRHLFSKAFDLFKKMQSHPAPARPDLETYTALLAAVLRRLGRPPVSHIYLHAVRSLARQMKAGGVIPDTFALNLVIKAYSQCAEMDDAIRVFKEMCLYGCEPNEYSYGYIVRGLCQKGWIRQAMELFKEMREKGLVPSSSVYMAAVCGLALERRFEEATEVLFDMLENRMAPDILTYRTLLEGLCREGRADDAFQLLEEMGKRRGAMDRRMYSDLLDGLHWLCQPHD